MIKLSDSVKWRVRAKCLGADLDEFAPSGSESIGSYERRADFRRYCEECPVIRECAREALLEKSIGTVRGGVLLPPKENFKLEPYQKLIQVAEPLLTQAEKDFLALPSPLRDRARQRTTFIQGEEVVLRYDPIRNKKKRRVR